MDRVDFHRPVRGFTTGVLSEGRTKLFVSEQPQDFALIGQPAFGDVIADASDGENAIFKGVTLGGYKSNFVTPQKDDRDYKVVITDFALASHVLGWGSEFFKSDHGPIPADARWITVHPNGGDSKGQPILVVPAGDKSGTFRVIGGAGGKPNMLKLRGVKSESEYKSEFAERAAAKREKTKEQVRRDKELGLHDAKVEARKNINGQRRKAERDFIKTVSVAMGWKDDALQI